MLLPGELLPGLSIISDAASAASLEEPPATADSEVSGKHRAASGAQHSNLASVLST